MRTDDRFEARRQRLNALRALIEQAKIGDERDRFRRDMDRLKEEKRQIGVQLREQLKERGIRVPA